MCAIAGVWSGGGTSDLQGLVGCMADAMRHRGPDGRGVWHDAENAVALGHRRLAIIDLSARGQQPMKSADGRFVIVFNGEIYNFSDLRAQLEDGGLAPSWQGGSDTEVLLEAIAGWGLEETLARIDGQFAFALWDCLDRRLHLARDRFGEKPLYYGIVGQDFVFGSELKALRKHPAFDETLDHRALASYLRHGYVPHPLSIYQAISKLGPGCRLVVGAPRRDRIEVHSYWTAHAAIASARQSPFAGTQADAADTLDRLIRRSVASRMVADVPLGVLLSGGIDSAMIASAAQAQSVAPVKTFTIGSRDPRLNEAEHAADLARRIGSDHTELYVDAEQALAVTPHLARIYDEPFADFSQIPTFLVSALARGSVTVALSGDGGDELFGGYNRHRLGGAWNAVAGIPLWARRLMSSSVRAVSPQAWDAAADLLGPLAPKAVRTAAIGDKLHKWAGKATATDARDFLRRLLSTWDDSEAASFALREMPLDILDEAGPAALDGSFAEMAMYYDTRFYLPDDILTKVDRASMANGLEVRAPFLDAALFEFAWSLPLEFKVSGGRGKQILRRVLARYLPVESFDRPKRGFTVPVAAWLRGPLRDWAESLLTKTKLEAAGLDATVTMTLWRDHLSGVRNWDMPLWTALMLLDWLDCRASFWERAA